MAVIKKTDVTGAVTALLVHKAGGGDDESVAAEPLARARAGFAGLEGDSHSGLTRRSDVRVRQQYAEGTEIRNVRQITMVSDEDLSDIARELGAPRIEPAWLGANIAVRGVPAFTLIPPSARLIFSGGAALVVDAENEPCRWPGAEIDKHFPGCGGGFVKAALNRRGVTCWVEREGEIAEGDTVEIHLPPQRIWPGGKTAQ